MANNSSVLPAQVGAVAWERWRGVVLIVLALVVGGMFGWFLAPRPPAENSPEVTFARDMMAHHEQAVEMAVILRDRSTNEDLRTFAIDIVLTQQAQIGQMQGWLGVWGRPITGAEPPMAGHGTMMGMATQQQIDELQTLPVAEAEVAFLKLMIPHHRGAVSMAQQVLQQTQRPEVVRLATAIIQGQQSEINYMQQLLAQRSAS